MNCKSLIDAGTAHLEKYNVKAPSPAIRDIFISGAGWMQQRLVELRGGEDLGHADEEPSHADEAVDYAGRYTDSFIFDNSKSYTVYGILKYGICVSGCILSITWSLQHSPWTIPFSLIVFYILEIHGLFLFPLLIDNVKRPLLTSICTVYKIGFGTCLFRVIPIAFFMLIGLLKKKDQYRNWQIGCLAIIIWYNNEVRNRIQASL